MYYVYGYYMAYHLLDVTFSPLPLSYSLSPDPPSTYYLLSNALKRWSPGFRISEISPYFRRVFSLYRFTFLTRYLLASYFIDYASVLALVLVFPFHLIDLYLYFLWLCSNIIPSPDMLLFGKTPCYNMTCHLTIINLLTWLVTCQYHHPVMLSLNTQHDNLTC